MLKTYELTLQLQDYDSHQLEDLRSRFISISCEMDSDDLPDVGQHMQCKQTNGNIYSFKLLNIKEIDNEAINVEATEIN